MKTQIPRVLHRIWLGKNPMPDDFLRWGQLWQELHPAWEIKTWTDDNLPILVNQRLFDSTDHFGTKANLLRLELLEQFGGVYVDCDMEPLQPIDELLDSTCVLAEFSWGQIGNAFMASIPHQEFISAAIKGLPGQFERIPKAPSPVLCGSIYLTYLALSFELKRLSPVYFYPLTFTECQKMSSDSMRESMRCQQSFGIHHWRGSYAAASKELP